jgi:energy-coupling factor transport system permease protein
MNPSLKLFLALLVSLEITFAPHLWANVALIAAAVCYLFYKHISWHSFLWLVLITLIPALALFCTIAYFSPSHNIHFAWVLVSRLYVYVTAGACVSFTTSSLKLVQSLEQNFHLPAKFVYGLLAALNLIPRIKREVNTIRIAGQMRGVTLHWWSPRLYFKAILAASQWADQLAQAMETHGFVENAPRTFAHQITIGKRDWFSFGILLFLVQIIIIALP